MCGLYNRKKTMNIALCTDENFSIPALICLTSIFENNKDEDCHAFVLTDGISEKTKYKFNKLSDVYQKPIDVITIDRHRFDGLTVSDRYPVSMYYRFLLPEMLPKERVALYLDCDIIVRHSLKALFAQDIKDYAIGAVVSQSCDWVKWYNDYKLSMPFFNSGVLLMNLDYWRQNYVFESLVRWVAENPNGLWLPDQSALNKVLEGKVKYLNYTYNFQERWTRPLQGSYMHFSKWKEIEIAGKDPIVIHYCDAEKPWFVESRHKFKDDFLFYATMHEFVGFKPVHRYGRVYKFAKILGRVGLKLRYWAEILQKKSIKNLKISN